MDNSKFSLMTFPMIIDIWNKTMTVADTLTAAEQSGFCYVDVMNVSQKQVGEYLAAIDSTGVRVYTYIASIPFLAHKSQITRQINEAVQTAKQLSAQLLMIVPFGFLDVYIARLMGKTAVKGRMIAGFREAVRVGRRRGIRVCFETTPYAESGLSGTKDCLDILEAVDGLEFVFDTANMLPNGDDPMEACKKLCDRIAHIHLKDVKLSAKAKAPAYCEHTKDGYQMECVVWGDGIIPINSLVKLLQKVGYSGKYAVEYVRPQRQACRIQAHLDQLERFRKYMISFSQYEKNA